MKRNFILTGILVVGVCLPASATIINVPDDYETIQQGINASTDGDTVLVHPGTYVENINFNGHNIVLGSLFLTTGDTTYISQTIIDGDSSGSVVTFESGEDSTTIISGFTIQNGFSLAGGGICANNAAAPKIKHNIIRSNVVGYYFIGSGAGGGIYCDGAPSITNNIIQDNIAVFGYVAYGLGGGIHCTGSPIISDNLITRNYAGGGGGISCFYDSSAIISNNDIIDNDADAGGGIICQYSYVNIHENYIANNSATSKGAGIYCNESSTVIKSNIIFGNSTDNNGSGIYSEGGDNDIIENSICENSAAHAGGGVLLFRFNSLFENNIITHNSAGRAGGLFGLYMLNPYIKNNLILNNSASFVGGALFEGINPVLINNIIRGNDDQQLYVWEGVPIVSYCNIQDTLWPGEGNIDIDPLFRDPENGDFHLMSTECGDPYDSPCIDAGSPAILDSLLDCSWGLGTNLSDMGAYGGGDSVTVGIDDYVNSLPDKFLLMQNYPNPFNAATSLKYTLEQTDYVALTIYNILGQRVSGLFDGFQQAGEHAVVWDATDYPSGVYFARMETAEKSSHIKMVLLK